MLNDHGPDFAAAISADFGNRPDVVTVLAEITPVIAAIRHARKHLARWSKARRVSVEMAWRPGTAKVIPQPLGVVGIIAPWNYPLELSLAPLVAALAAGNRALIKPSELTPRLSDLLKVRIAEYFREDEVAVVTGGADVASALPFDHLLFTGSTPVGRKVAEAAAHDLTPVTLELGGKSPTIIDPSANIATAAERLAFSKFLNAGQTCIAPDYALVPQALQAQFVEAMKASIAKQYPSIAGNADYNTIVSERHADRLRALVDDARTKGATVIEVGSAGNDRRTIAPTLILGATPEMTVMQEEVFGPILPIDLSSPQTPSTRRLPSSTHGTGRWPSTGSATTAPSRIRYWPRRSLEASASTTPWFITSSRSCPSAVWVPPAWATTTASTVSGPSRRRSRSSSSRAYRARR